jgi:hypothetical protein
MKKKSLVWGLYRSVRDEKMTSFFSNNFAEERSQQFFLSTMNDRDQSIDITQIDSYIPHNLQASKESS